MHTRIAAQNPQQGTDTFGIYFLDAFAPLEVMQVSQGCSTSLPGAFQAKIGHQCFLLVLHSPERESGNFQAGKEGEVSRKNVDLLCRANGSQISACSGRAAHLRGYQSWHQGDVHNFSECLHSVSDNALTTAFAERSSSLLLSEAPLEDLTIARDAIEQKS